MKLQDFRKFRDPNIIQPTRTNIIIPAFILPAPIWAGASTIIAEFELSNSYFLSFKLPIRAFGSYFVAAVRWSEDSDVYRYKFWEDEDSVLFYPVYNGEKIGLSAVIEIWSVNSAEFPALTSSQTLQSSVLNFPTEGCGNCCVNPSVEQLLVATIPTSVPPYAYCNPFCDTLCS